MRSLRHILVFLMLLAARSGSQPITFAWLSDTHVGSATGAEDLRQSVRDINRQTGIRFILLTGDITETGSDSELSLAHSILDSLRFPYHIIPGNHDTKWSESGGAMFLRLWGADRFEFREGPYRFIGMHEGPRMRMADGYWAPEDVRWLDSVVQSIMPGESVFYATHYPVDSSIANWYVVLDRLKALPVQLVLVGHGHRNCVEDFEGIPGVMCRSNLRDGEGFPGYLIGRITADSCIFYERRSGWASEERWHAVPLLGERASQPGGPWSRPSYSVNQKYPNVRSEWEVPTGFTIAAGPALWDTLVVLADASGAVRCLGLSSGTELWRFNARGAIYSTPEVSDGRVVVGSVDSSIACLDVENGNLLWRLGASSSVLGTAAIHKGKVFIGSGRGMQAIDLRTGARLWESHVTKGFVECRPLVRDGKVIFGAWDGHLYALDESDGRVLWSWEGDSPGMFYSPAACWPVASGKEVFIVAPDRKMTVLDMSSGRVIWRSGIHQVRESIGASGDTVFVRLMRDTIMAFRPDSAAPAVLWSTAVGFGYDINSAMLVEKGGTVYYGTKDGLICALDRGTGAILWKHRVGAGPVNTIQPVDSRSVVCTDFGGIVRYVRGPRRMN